MSLSCWEDALQFFGRGFDPPHRPGKQEHSESSNNENVTNDAVVDVDSDYEYVSNPIKVDAGHHRQASNVYKEREIASVGTHRDKHSGYGGNVVSSGKDTGNTNQYTQGYNHTTQETRLPSSRFQGSERKSHDCWNRPSLMLSREPSLELGTGEPNRDPNPLHCSPPYF